MLFAKPFILKKQFHNVRIYHLITFVKAFTLVSPCCTLRGWPYWNRAQRLWSRWGAIKIEEVLGIRRGRGI